MSGPPQAVVFVGTGRAALALGHVLARGDCALPLHYVGRHPDAPDHPLFREGHARYSDTLRDVPADPPGVLLLAVADDALAEAVGGVRRDGPCGPGWSVLHLSGVHDASVLEPLRARGCALGTLHPLQALSRPETALEMLPRSSFTVSGDADAQAAARALVACLGGQALTIPDEGRGLYHAAASLVAGGVPVLMEAATRWMSQAGGEPEASRAALQGLLEGVVANLRVEGLGAASGPLIRGDVGTVARHLQRLDGDDRDFYAQVSRALLRAFGPTLPPDTRAAFHALLHEDG